MFQNATVTLCGAESAVAEKDRGIGSAINAVMTKRREPNFRDMQIDLRPGLNSFRGKSVD
jgi:hypothetical protein